VQPPLVLLQQGLRSEDVLQLAGDALPHVAHEVALAVVPLQLLEVFVVYELQFGAVEVADLALEVGTQPQVQFEALQIVESARTELAVRVVQRYLPSVAGLALLEMQL